MMRICICTEEMHLCFLNQLKEQEKTISTVLRLIRSILVLKVLGVFNEGMMMLLSDVPFVDGCEPLVPKVVVHHKKVKKTALNNVDLKMNVLVVNALLK